MVSLQLVHFYLLLFPYFIFYLQTTAISSVDGHMVGHLHSEQHSRIVRDIIFGAVSEGFTTPPDIQIQRNDDSVIIISLLVFNSAFSLLLLTFCVLCAYGLWKYGFLLTVIKILRCCAVIDTWIQDHRTSRYRPANNVPTVVEEEAELTEIIVDQDVPAQSRSSGVGT